MDVLLKVVDELGREAARGRHLALALLVAFVLALLALEPGDEVVQAQVALAGRKGLLEPVLDHVTHARSRRLGHGNLQTTTSDIKKGYQLGRAFLLEF